MVNAVALPSSSTSLGMGVSPAIVEALDNSIRDALQGTSHAFFVGVWVSAIVVAIGVLMEGPEILHELWPRLFIWFTWKSIPKHDRFVRAIKKIAFVGWLLIGIGVLGEGIFEGLQNRAEGQFQTFNDILLKDARQQSSAASQRAANAFERAARTEEEASQENERAAKAEQQASEENARAAEALKAAEIARKNAEGFSLQIAQANERASRAEQASDELKKESARLTEEAESERLARTKLAQQLAWRDLTVDQANRIAGKLTPFAGQQVDFITFSSEGECLNFTNELYGTIVFGGHWVLNPNRKWSMLINLIVGVEVHVSEKANPSTKDAASKLNDALTAEGVSSTLKTDPAQDAPNPAMINVTVGKSPNSMLPIGP